MKHYYALDWTYNINTYWIDSDIPCASVKVFDSEADRKEWVNSDPLSGGNAHRTTVDAKEARRIMLATTEFCGSDYEYYKSEIPTEELIKLYFRY